MSSEIKKLGEALAAKVAAAPAGIAAEFVFFANVDNEDPAPLKFLVTPNICRANTDSRSSTQGKIGFIIHAIQITEEAKDAQIEAVIETQEKLIEYFNTANVTLNGQVFKPVIEEFEPFDPEEILSGAIHGRIALNFTGWF